ncbi:hypothetical protein [Geobacter sulfurreducens]|uniref:hypothetical protein n=1 Tax=Geobacter sulfurreducens TaxID=35554 RepID=UPI0020B8039A|nr:hypothetical protein [Geobacter sulfurreducens]UTG94015.1 hypothetical protein J8622_06765 [Geobacter sulfurreducens]
MGEEDFIHSSKSIGYSRLAVTIIIFCCVFDLIKGNFMNFVVTRKLIGGSSSLAGSEWYYEYSTLHKYFDDDSIKKYITWVSKQSAAITSNWNDELNSEWLVRMFLSARMVLGASVMASSSEYAIEKNLRITVPYLNYYTLLYSLKCLIFTLPSVQWKNGGVITQNHSATINYACDALARIDKTFSNTTKSNILKSKALRESISYRAPSSGDKCSKDERCPFDTCRVILELAQLNSEIFEKSLVKRASGKKFEIVDGYIERAFETEIEGHMFFDEEDYYRIGYFVRKYPYPANIQHMMSEGHVEDFFGSWVDKEDREDVFNPDENWQILFDVP